jgi:hypothetical protein
VARRNKKNRRTSDVAGASAAAEDVHFSPLELDFFQRADDLGKPELEAAEDELLL